MGISSKLNDILEQIHNSVKSSSKSLLAMVFKIVTGLLFGLTFALIGQEIFGFDRLLFLFVMIFIGGILYRIMLDWSLVSTLAFDLMEVMLAILLRMYIVMAGSHA